MDKDIFALSSSTNPTDDIRPAGANAYNKLGRDNLYYSDAGSSSLCFCGIIPHYTSTIYTIYLGGRDDFWLWFWISSNQICSRCGCITSILYWLSFPSQNSRLVRKYPKKAAILTAAGEGNWFHQFKAVTLIRISPFPYIMYNYCAVATHVKHGPYILGSLIGMVPKIFVAIYTGILVQTLANASQERHTLSAPQILLYVGGFLLTVVTTIVFTV